MRASIQRVAEKRKKEVVGKVQHDREFMAGHIKVENMNRKNHCDLVKMGAKRRKLRMRRLFRGDSENI
jgi:hypothetical protein